MIHTGSVPIQGLDPADGSQKENATFSFLLHSPTNFQKGDQMPKGKPTRWSFRISVEGKALEALNTAADLMRKDKTKGMKRGDLVALYVNEKMTNATALHKLGTAVARAKMAEADAAAKAKKIAKLEAALEKARGETKPSSKRTRGGTIVTSS